VEGIITFKGKECRVDKCAGEEVTLRLIPEKKIMVRKGKGRLGEYHLRFCLDAYF
jgi:hypothetical protein